MERSWAVSAERLTGDFDAAERAVIDRFVGAAGAWAESLGGPFSSATTTSARTTCSLGGGRLVVLDWQTVGWGAPMFDVAYLFGTSVSPEARRAIERDEIRRARRRARRRLGRSVGRVPPGVVGGAADAGAADRQREGVRPHRPHVPPAPAPGRADGARPRGARSSWSDHRGRRPPAARGARCPPTRTSATSSSRPRRTAPKPSRLVVNVHPNKGLIDAAFALSDGDTHDSLFAADRLGDELACGPIRLSSRADALAADRGRGSRRPALRASHPAIEEERVTRRRDGRVVQDRSRYAQLGPSTARSTAAPHGWFAGRDHSWGIWDSAGRCALSLVLLADRRLRRSRGPGRHAHRHRRPPLRRVRRGGPRRRATGAARRHGRSRSTARRTSRRRA